MGQSQTNSGKITLPGFFQTCVLACCMTLLVLAVGFHYGQQVSTSRIDEPAQYALSHRGQIDRQVPIDRLATDPAPVSRSTVMAPAPLMMAAQAVSQPVTNTENKSLVSEDKHYLAEIEYLSKTANRLRKRVASLEWETLTLESDLLSKEVELGQALDKLNTRNRLRRDVYNITNVPVGSYVAPARTTGRKDVQVSQQTQVRSTTPTALSSSQQAPMEQDTDVQQESIRQRVFFGPAPDRYEDLVNPGFAETPHQSQTRGE